MAKAKKLPSGSWRVQVYSHTETVHDKDGKPKTKRIYESFTSDDTSAAGKREAEYAAAEFALNKKNKLNSSKTLFKDALTEYINGREPVLSPRTIREYRRLKDNDLQPLENIKICDITQDIIQNYINEYSKDKSPKSTRCTHGLISSVLKENRPEFALNTSLPKKVRPNLYVPSDNEVKRLLIHIEGTEMEVPVMLAAFGPMRRGEICALDSEHIKGNIVHIDRSMVLGLNNDWVIKSPKSYAGNRYIEFPDFVIDKIKDKRGNIVNLNPTQITCRFNRILKSAQLPHFRFHDLRHYAASILHAIGIPDQYIIARGGWESDATLKAVYRHTLDEEAAKMSNKANSYFSELCNTKCNTKK